MMDKEGQPIKVLEKITEIIDGDLNHDGKFDKEDLKLAAKILSKGKKKV